MKIYIGSDHAGFDLKQKIIQIYETSISFGLFKDCGCDSVESVDYPDIAESVCTHIINDLKNNVHSLGILICGTGIGMNITANKFPNIRCAVANDIFSAKMAKKHNNVNVISLGARIIDFDMATSIINIILDTEFEGGRHNKRIEKIKDLEENWRL